MGFQQAATTDGSGLLTPKLVNPSAGKTPFAEDFHFIILFCCSSTLGPEVTKVKNIVYPLTTFSCLCFHPHIIIIGSICLCVGGRIEATGKSLTTTTAAW